MNVFAGVEGNRDRTYLGYSMMISHREKAMKKTVLCAVVALMATYSQGELLLGWDFSGYAGNEAAGTNAYAATGISSPSLITRGVGVNAYANGDSFSATGWNAASLENAISSNDYFEFSIAASAGYALTITNWNALFYRTATSASNWVLRSSADSFAANIDSYTITNDLRNDLDGVLNLTGSSLTFRLYGWGASSSTGAARFEGTGNELELYGTVSAIPEPTTVAFMGLGLGAAFLARRRLKK